MDIFEQDDGFIVYGKRKHNLNGDAELNTYHDHRLAMSFYIAGLICEKEIAINGFEWTNISFPEIEELMVNLYLTLWMDLDKAELMSKENNHHHLMTSMSMPLEKIVMAREKLEAIGLLKTF